MRMGRPTKKRKSSSRQTKNSNGSSPPKPKYSSPSLVVGEVSSNVIQSILAPILTEMAVRSVEEYADAMLVYQTAVDEEKRAREKASSEIESKQEEDQQEEEIDVGFEKGEEVEIDVDGNVLPSTGPSTGPSIGPSTGPSIEFQSSIPRPSANRLFTNQSDIDELNHLLLDVSQHFSTPSNAWKAHLKSAKFERLLDEKYGRLRPFITSHPEVEAFVKNIQRKHALGVFSPFRRGDPPINRTTAIILLFMMHRNGVKIEAVLLTAIFFLVGLQPWALVALVALGRYAFYQRRGKRVGGMPRALATVESYYARDFQEDEDEEAERAKKYAFLETPVGTKFSAADLSLADGEYDVVLLGTGPETLYTAALLSRAGRKTLVLSPNEDASGCICIADKSSRFGSKVPFDVASSNVAHLNKQQPLLAPALCTTTDTQGGIRFARVGSASDGYAHTILSVPGLGTDSISSHCIPVVINAGGPAALAEYAANYLGDGLPGTDLEGKDNGNSTSLGYLKACSQINAGAGDYYLSKLFPNGTDSLQSSDSNVYQQASIRPASVFLNKCLPLNTHVRSLMAAIGMANENISPDKTSMAAHVTNLCAMTSPEGMAYPVGGPRALCHALSSVIEQCGGRVVTGVALQELIFDKLEEEPKGAKKKDESKTDDASKDHGPKPRCKGVRLENGLEVTVSQNGVVVSNLGFMATFLHLLPPTMRLTYGVPVGLSALSERRPLMKILVGLRGTKDDLNLTGADWYRLPNATLPRDELDPLTGQVKFGAIGVEDTETTDETITNKDIASTTDNTETISISTTTPQGGRGKRGKSSTSNTTNNKKTHKSKFLSGISWMKVSFPSAKDPSWTDRHGDVSTCVITIEADDDFVRMFDTKPKIFSISKNASAAPTSGEFERLRDRVLKDLLDNFPQIEGNIECIQVCGPYRSGLTHNPARYAIKGNRPEMPYPGLFMSGSDLTVGDSFSGAIVGGWLASNAILGYSFLDYLYLGKNITSDLEQFLEEPSMANERNGVIVEDLAVPFSQIVSPESDDKQKSIDHGNDTSAESSKEE